MPRQVVSSAHLRLVPNAASEMGLGKRTEKMPVPSAGRHGHRCTTTMNANLLQVLAPRLVAPSAHQTHAVVRMLLGHPEP